MENNNERYVLSDKIEPFYHVHFEDDPEIAKTDSSIIISSNRELEMILLCLEENVSVSISRTAEIAHRESVFLLLDKNISEVKKEIKWTYKEYEDAKKLITKIPMPDYIKNAFSDRKTKINKEFVHKSDEKNVLISEAEVLGKMYYFLGGTDTKEILLDHYSDHMSGIMIFEAVRQAGIASIHLLDIPLTGVIVITKSVIEYDRFIEYGKPYYIQTMPVVRSRGGAGYCIFNVIQDERSCVKGYFSGFLYKTQEDYLKFARKINR